MPLGRQPSRKLIAQIWAMLNQPALMVSLAAATRGTICANGAKQMGGLRGLELLTPTLPAAGDNQLELSSTPDILYV